MSKIALLSSGHPPLDERIFHKFAAAFNEAGYPVCIINSTTENHSVINGITISAFDGNKLPLKSKINRFVSALITASPDLIICSEPLPALAGYIYKRKFNKSLRIVQDITEWYPENVALKLMGLKKYFAYLTLYLFNLLTVSVSTALIIGEPLKAKRYKRIAPAKDKIIISYYPPLQIVPDNYPVISDTFKIGFTGLLTEDRGIFNVIEVMKKISELKTDRKIVFNIIGKFLDTDTKDKFERLSASLNINIKDYTGYYEYIKEISSYNLILDLREKTFIYNNSLPIKIFEYMALGIPSVYSDTKSIGFLKNEPPFGFFSDPHDYNNIAQIILNYINNPKLTESHSLNGKTLIKEKYNWESEKEKLLLFVQKLLKSENIS